MRFMVKATIPLEAGNALVRDPDMGKRMDAIMGDLKPEAVYFCIDNGQRTLYIVVNADKPEDLPKIAEPLWLGLKADVTISPAFVPEEMERAMPALEELRRKY